MMITTLLIVPEYINIFIIYNNIFENEYFFCSSRIYFVKFVFEIAECYNIFSVQYLVPSELHFLQ